MWSIVLSALLLLAIHAKMATIWPAQLAVLSALLFMAVWSAQMPALVCCVPVDTTSIVAVASPAQISAQPVPPMQPAPFATPHLICPTTPVCTVKMCWLAVFLVPMPSLVCPVLVAIFSTRHNNASRAH